MKAICQVLARRTPIGLIRGAFSVNRILVNPLALLITILQTGCMPIPQIPLEFQADVYSPSADNVLTLKKAGDYKVNVGKFSSAAYDGRTLFGCTTGSETRSIDAIESPYQDSFANYLEWAIYSDLFHAEKIAPDVDVELSAVLLKNEVCIPLSFGGDNNYVAIEARFIVKKAGEYRYDETKSVRHEWAKTGVTTFILRNDEYRAKKEYPLAVQKLLATLYADEAFINALK